jgi:hypothetical protein
VFSLEKKYFEFSKSRGAEKSPNLGKRDHDSSMPKKKVVVSHSHPANPDCSLDVPSAVDLMTIMQRAPEKERIVTSVRKYYVRFGKPKPSATQMETVYKKALKLEHGACSGSLAISSWLKKVRSLGFIVTIERV